MTYQLKNYLHVIIKILLNANNKNILFWMYYLNLCENLRFYRKLFTMTKLNAALYKLYYGKIKFDIIFIFIIYYLL